MTIIDPISDLFTRIRNALKEGHESTSAPYSLIKLRILEILKTEGFINEVHIVDDSLSKRFLKVDLKYRKNGDSLIQNIKRISKPSKRIYTQKQNIKRTQNGFGISILSTSKGILTGRNARLKNVGGEILGEVW